MAKVRVEGNEPCPVARTVALVGDRWSLLLVRDALDGTRRFGDFQRGLGVARSMLTERLRSLVEAGIFAVQPASDGSAYQEYVLTPKGMQLFPLMVALRQWGEQHLFEAGEAHSHLIEIDTGKPLAPMLPMTADGRTVAPDATVVKKVR